MVRRLREDDLPAFSELSHELFLDAARQLTRGARRCSAARRVEYFRQLFLDNPWLDDELSSLVYEDASGQPMAFLGVIPRAMRLGRERIRVATSTEFIVHPACRGQLAAIELLRTFLAGPQDASIADNANEPSRRLWLALGGQAAPLYSIGWQRILRPTRYASHAFCDDLPRGALLERLLLPLCSLLDGLARYLPANRVLRPDPAIATEPLDVPALLTCIEAHSAGAALRAEFDCDSLTWLLQMAQQRNGASAWRVRGVRRRDGELLGAYIYFCAADGWAPVVQVYAAPQHLPAVLGQLARDALRDGAIAINGRTDPRGLIASALRYTGVRWPARWLLIHSRRPEILTAVQRGDALLTRLDGEWWICAHELTATDPRSAAPAAAGAQRRGPRIWKEGS